MRSVNVIVNLNVKIDHNDGKPSGSCVVTGSTIQLKSHPCKCVSKDKDDHTRDFRSGVTTGQPRAKEKAWTAVSTILIAEVIGMISKSICSPAATAVYPTDAKERKNEG